MHETLLERSSSLLFSLSFISHSSVSPRQSSTSPYCVFLRGHDKLIDESLQSYNFPSSEMIACARFVALHDKIGRPTGTSNGKKEDAFKADVAPAKYSHVTCFHSTILSLNIPRTAAAGSVHSNPGTLFSKYGALVVARHFISSSSDQ